MKKGLELTFNNGDKDWYDPVDDEDGLKETDTQYVIDNGYAKYPVLKSVVKSYRWYDLCPKCGKEIYADGCHSYGCD